MDRSHSRPSIETRGARLETLWIFDADFEGLVGDDAWTFMDLSGTLGMDNYWHHDTIRMGGFSHLGDTTWWCGTSNECWRQPRGYGNGWMQILERHFTEANGLSGVLTLEYDQRFAMEKKYNYGYVDIRSSATSDTWYTVVTVTNPGFEGTPGMSQDWDSTHPDGGGEVSVDITSEGMGVEFDLRFRFESDGAYSSQDQWDNPTASSCKDGAWQLDNIEILDDGTPVFYDDAESYGQTGVVFWRGRFGIDFVTGRTFTCDDRAVGSYMYAAVDPFTSKMIDDQWTWLMSPPIDVSGAEKLVGQWDMWLDMPELSGDGFDLFLASNDGGQTWESYACLRENPESDWWWTPPPVNQIVPGSRIVYYFSATDGVGNTATYPDDAPNRVYEFSILPINGSTANPGILLVDKHGRRTPSEARDYLHTSEYYYREMLDILGYEWDVYDVEVPSGTNTQSRGPDSVAFKYYDTQVWFTNEFNAYTIEAFDQANLIYWLHQSSDGKERNLLLTGNDIGFELIQAEDETLSFYETWLASGYLESTVGSVLQDSVPRLRDNLGGYSFMTHGDGECILTGGCPSINYFDVVEPRSGIGGNEVVADYMKQDSSARPAGVAYTHQTLGYQTVNLGFGMEFMMDGMLPGGYYATGVEDRADLMGNVMDYFGRVPSGPGTGVVDASVKNELSHAYPNPFNPATKIAYSVKEAGPVRIEVYNVAGRVVRTLLDVEVEAGASGYVVWDGRDGGGEQCASGVYFYRIAAPGFTRSHKMIMLK